MYKFGAEKWNFITKRTYFYEKLPSTHSDPTSYVILLQLRTVVTPIIYQIIFDRRLSLMQWISIGVLVTGTLTKQISLEKVLFFLKIKKYEISTQKTLSRD